MPGAGARGKGGRQDKRTRHRAASKACLHVGVALHAAASPPCRVGREARANPAMSACFARPDSLALAGNNAMRSVGHTSELQSLMRTSYAGFCLQKKKKDIMHLSTYTN